MQTQCISLKQFRTAVSILALLFLSAGWSDASDSLIGTWRGQYINGDRVTFAFTPNGTVSWTVVSDKLGNSVTIRSPYKIDMTTAPINLDFLDLGTAGYEGVKILGIVKFLDLNTMLIDLHPSKTGNSDARPSEFNDSSVRLKRDQ